MLKGETEAIQHKLYEAVKERDREEAKDSFQFFDTICGATQERQDALFEMLKQKISELPTTNISNIRAEKLELFNHYLNHKVNFSGGYLEGESSKLLKEFFYSRRN